MHNSIIDLFYDFYKFLYIVSKIVSKQKFHNSIIESIHDFFYKFLNIYHLYVEHLDEIVSNSCPEIDNRFILQIFYTFLDRTKYISFVRRTSRSSTETRKLFYDGQNSIIESIHDFFYKFLNTYHLHVKHLHRRQSKLFRILVPNSIIGSFHKFFTFLDSNEQIIYLIPDKKEKISQFDRRENYSNFY